MMIRGRTRVLPVVDLPDEVAQHGLGDLEIGDDPVLHGADGHDVARGAAQHHLGFLAHGQHPVAGPRSFLRTATTEGSLRTMPFPFDIDQGVGGAQVDGQVIGKPSQDGIQKHGYYSLHRGSTVARGGKSARGQKKRPVPERHASAEHSIPLLTYFAYLGKKIQLKNHSNSLGRVSAGGECPCTQAPWNFMNSTGQRENSPGSGQACPRQES